VRRAGPPRARLRPGRTPASPGHYWDRRAAIELAKRLPARAWRRLPAGPGARGPRWYDWALIEAADPALTDGGGPHWLLIRRSIADGGYAFYRARAPGPVPLAPLVTVAGSRWRIKDGFAAGKELAAPGRAPGPPLDVLVPVTIVALLTLAFLAVRPRLATGTQTMTS
jgi:hypothetical protein